ncbi:MAG: ATP-dependent DNA ligase [Alphaproteobacteria bacterium]|nr:ATP-dependent DNA ligase [Alphaproteobacteria bacterium]
MASGDVTGGNFGGRLPVMPPLDPMLAKGVGAVPEGEGWLFEPKWDGFRVIAFRDGGEVYLQSRDRKPLLRYFPELAEPLMRALPERAVVDGEIVIATDRGLDFGLLQMRLHPAESRVRKLAGEIPASLILWDLLASGDESLLDVPFATRRARLEQEVRFAAPVHLTPIATDGARALDWFDRFEGAGLDGVVAKPAGDVYQPGKRAMQKVKRDRTIDCVLCGFRWHKSGPVVGSLILGLFDAEGRLHQIGVASSFTAKRRKELVDELEPLRENALDAHPWRSWAELDGHERRAGVQSRWNAGRDLSWEAVRLERVVEVKVNQVTDGRLRHPGHFVRWRADREPASCTFGQLDVAPPAELTELLGR